MITPARVTDRRSLSPQGLTLIELLVAIIIMVTVLAAVIPMLSPNNQTRKINEASRQLRSMFAQAQAQAARDGRRYGVGFQESLVGDPAAKQSSGMALSAYFIAEPPPFAGFSENSRVRLLTADNPDTVPEDVMAVGVQFVLADQLLPANGPNERYAFDPPPPGMLRFGDVVSVGAFEFQITDPDRDGDGNPDAGSDGDFKHGDFYKDPPANPRAQFQCRMASNTYFEPRAVLEHDPPQAITSGDVLPRYGWTNPLRYAIRRLPANTSEEPVQFPRAIGIDLAASGFGVNPPPVPAPPLLPSYGLTTIASPALTAANGGNAMAFQRPLSVAVMFNPNGELEGLYVNGEKWPTSVERLNFLLGGIESGNPDLNDADFVNNPVADDAELAQRRERLNWLDPDSRWVVIGARTGRIVATPVSYRDPRLTSQTTLNDQIAEQIIAARQLARDLGESGAP